MKEILFQHANLIQPIVLFTFVAVLVKHERGNVVHRFLIAILFVSLSNEVVSYYYLTTGGKSGSFYTISVLLHNVLWLSLLSRIANLRKIILVILPLYVGFAIYNLIMLEGPDSFNFNTFTLGAILYLVLFIIESFRRLKLEQLSFFTSSNYILLCAPLLLFVFLSFIFGFKSKTLYQVKIFGDFPLYRAVTYFANVVYYTLINIYIFRRKRIDNGN